MTTAAASPTDVTSGQYNYVVTAQKPTSVTHSVVGNFTHEDELNLVVAKCTRVEIHLLTPQGLQAMMDVPIYGRIATMELVRPPFEKKPMLFILTERNMFCVLSYDAAKGELITRAMGDLTDRVGRPSECGPIGAVDPECRMYGLHLYDGLFKVIPMDQTGQLREAFSVRLEELQVFDVKFLAGTPKPTIAVLYQDTKEGRHIKTYEVCLKDKDFNPGPWAQNDVESGSRFLIAVPAPLGGVVVVGEKVIAYLNKETTHGVGDGGGGGGGGGGGMIVKAIAMQSDATIMTYGAVDKDGSRYLLSDSAGRLHLLVLMHDKTRVRALKLESLGQTSIASSLSYLDNGVVYVGSAYGDSQLVRLHSTPIPIAGGGGGDGDGGGGGGGEIVPVDSGAVTDAPNYVEVLESFTSLGPIVDFVVVDLDRHGQGQVVTCSGVHKDGSLRVVRNGVGIHEQAAIELPGVKGCWALKNADDAVSDTFLVVAFIGETRILAINDKDELDETEFEGFAGDERALACANVDGGYACQVTSGGIRLVDVATGALRARWTPEPGERVSVAAANRTQVVVALEGGTLVSVAAGGGGDAMDVDDASPLLRELARVNVGHEIACLDVTPLADPRAASSEICAVGLWSAEVRVLATATLEELSSAPLTDAEVIPRAVLLCSFEGIPYLLAGLGDGQLFTFALMGERSGIIGDGKKLSVGTQPITLKTFRNKNTTHVFAGSDRPTVIYSQNKKLIYSNVNLREVLHMCAFNCDAFPDSLALASESELTIGGIDDIQKLHIRTVPLGEQPRRIAHQPASRTFAVLTSHVSDVTNEESFYVRLFDDVTFETLFKYRLDVGETDSSIISCSFADDPASYYVVGTAFSLPEEVEPSRGRILVLRADEGRLSLVAEKEVKGAVYNLNAFNGKLLAGINSKVQLFKWVSRGAGAGAGAGGGAEGGAVAMADGGGGGGGGGGAPAAATTCELASECSHHGHIVALYVDVRGDFIVVGDLMKSISLLVYKPDEGVIEERARDFNPNWMTAVCALDDETYLGAENSFNLFTVRKNSDAAADEERSRLDVIGEYHLGEFVNRFRAGSLVMRLPGDGDGAGLGLGLDASNEAPTQLFGTVNGAIGVVASLPESTHTFLAALQKAMNKVVSGVGGFSHDAWRSFHNEHRSRLVEARGFVDGDLIESFLDLRPEKASEVASVVGVGVEELTKRIEELVRITH